MTGWLLALQAIVTREALRFVQQRGRFVAALVRPLVWNRTMRWNSMRPAVRWKIGRAHV